MKKITLLMVALSLLLAFTGCNQKEKKIAKIIDGITEEQMGEINEIVAASWDLDADKVVFDIGYTHDTIYISCYDTFSIESPDRDLQKDFLFAALCSNSPETKGLLEQIAAVPAVLLFAYADDASHTLYLTESNPNEIKEALAKEYTPHDVLNSYMDLANADFVGKGEKLSIEDNYFVVSVFDKDYDVHSLIDSLKTEALNEDEDIFDIINWDKWEDKMSEDLQKETRESGIGFLFYLYKHQQYIFRELVKANLGFEFRLLDNATGNGFFYKCKNSDLKELWNNK